MGKGETVFYGIIAILLIGYLGSIAYRTPTEIKAPDSYGELIRIEVDCWENYGYIRFIYEHGTIEKYMGLGTNKFAVSELP